MVIIQNAGDFVDVIVLYFTSIYLQDACTTFLQTTSNKIPETEVHISQTHNMNSSYLFVGALAK
jgi:hypothetical protein